MSWSDVIYKFASVKNKLKSEVQAVAMWVGISWNGEIMCFKVVFEAIDDEILMARGHIWFQIFGAKADKIHHARRLRRKVTPSCHRIQNCFSTINN